MYKKQVAFHVIDTMNSKISECEDCIMQERLRIIRDLQNANDVSQVYSIIKNAMVYIEDKRHVIDSSKDTIIGAYSLISDTEC